LPQASPLSAPATGRFTIGITGRDGTSMTLLKRLNLIIDDGTITHVFYPVFRPDESAAVIVKWLSN
jgi:hypothetical protein